MIRGIQRMYPVFACAALVGCAASASPQWDSTFGDSMRQLAAQQLVDPAAPTKNGKQMPPADGRTVNEAMGRYVGTFRAPPPSNIITIGVGTSTTSSGGGQ